MVSCPHNQPKTNSKGPSPCLPLSLSGGLWTGRCGWVRGLFSEIPSGTCVHISKPGRRGDGCGQQPRMSPLGALEAETSRAARMQQEERWWPQHQSGGSGFESLPCHLKAAQNPGQGLGPMGGCFLLSLQRPASYVPGTVAREKRQSHPWGARESD